MIVIKTLIGGAVLLILAWVALDLTESWRNPESPWSPWSQIIANINIAVALLLFSAGILYWRLRCTVNVVRLFILVGLTIFLASSVTCNAGYIYYMNKLRPPIWQDEPELMLMFVAPHWLLLVLYGYSTAIFLLGTALISYVYVRWKARRSPATLQ